MEARTLAPRLESPDGFKAIMKGLTKNGRAKRSYAIWSAARHRGVYDNIELRHITHQNYGCAIMAFSTTGPMTIETREDLAAQSGQFPLGTIRAESKLYQQLEPWGWRERDDYDPSDHTIDALAEPHRDLIVYAMVTGVAGSGRPLVVHANVGGGDYIYPVPGDRLR